MKSFKIIKMSFFMCFLIVLAGTLPALAQYVGPNGVTITVKQVLDSGKDDDLVILKGYILRRLEDNTYLFSDATGEINVKILPEYWPAGYKIDDKTKVEISGEYDKHFFKANEIDVNDIIKIEKE